MTALRRFLLSLAMALVAAAAQATCGPTAVCLDASSSFTGEVILDGIRLTWSTDDESTAVAYYKLYRNNCPSDPDSCSVLVTTIQKAGSCGVTQDYEYTDHPDTPLSQWGYTVEVWTSSGTRQCAIDTVPQ